MPRYIVERTFKGGRNIPVNDDGAKTCMAVVGNNSSDGVTWVHSYVSEDKTKRFCVYDGPNPEDIRRVAEKNKLPVDRITQVSVLDPYFYRSSSALTRARGGTRLRARADRRTR